MDNKKTIFDAMYEKGKADARELASRAVSGKADGTALIAEEEKIPTWKQKDFSNVAVGTPYSYNGQVYKLMQKHNATGQPDWTPEKAVSLWDICHTKDPSKAKPFAVPQGTRGMYQTGECCVFEDKIYRCKTGNTVHSPKDYPQAWEVVQ